MLNKQYLKKIIIEEIQKELNENWLKKGIAGVGLAASLLGAPNVAHASEPQQIKVIDNKTIEFTVDLGREIKSPNMKMKMADIKAQQKAKELGIQGRMIGGQPGPDNTFIVKFQKI